MLTKAPLKKCTKITMITLSLIFSSLLIPINLSANDSSARVGAGGITLLKEENIRILQEVLEISQKKIKVRYRFLNESANDIRTTVAFPLPDYELDPELVEFKEFTALKKFKNFKNWVDGKPVAIKRMQKALIGTTDVTDELRKMGLTNKQIFETFGFQGTDGPILTKKQENAIEALFNKILGKRPKMSAWKVSETIYWEMVFPSGKEVEVSHEYTPNLGYATNYLHGNDRQNISLKSVPQAVNSNSHDNINDNKELKEACVDKETLQLIQRRIKSTLNKSPDSGIAVRLDDIEYILGTGRNWKGPIGSFSLKIFKETSDQIVSLCFPGKPKKVSPTAIEFTQTDYMPQDKLIIYFISVGSG